MHNDDLPRHDTHLPPGCTQDDLDDLTPEQRRPMTLWGFNVLALEKADEDEGR